MVHEQILKLLAKNSAQSPMTFADLLAISGLQPATLKMVLDQMYAAHSINQALVTRSGIIQREVWPTGMASQLNAYADPSKRVAPTPLPPLPRRNEIKTKLMEVTMTQDLEVSTTVNCRSTPPRNRVTMTQDLEVAEQMPKALVILKFIEANPNCNSAQISHATGIESPRAYIKAHISRGAVLVSGDNRKDMRMQLAAGRTAQAIYGNGYNKAKPTPSAALLAEVQAAHANVELPVGRVGFQPHAEPCSVGNELPTLPLLELADAEPAPTYDIPAFISKRADELPVEVVPAVKYDTDLGFYQAKAAVIIDELTAQACISTLFDLMPPQSRLLICRANGELKINITVDAFGQNLAKNVTINEVRETLNALHIVTVEMA